MDKRYDLLVELQELRIRKDDLESSKNFLIEEYNSPHLVILLSLTSPIGGFSKRCAPVLTKDNLLHLISVDIEEIEKQMEEKYKEMVEITNEHYHYGRKK